MNDGTPYLLEFEDEGNRVTNILRQSANGQMTLSLINGNTPDDTFKPGKRLYDETREIGWIPLREKFDYSVINEEKNITMPEKLSGLPNGLKEGKVFKNIDKSDTNIYVVCFDSNNGHYIKCFENIDEYKAAKSSGHYDKHPITIKHRTMTLYSLPTEEFQIK